MSNNWEVANDWVAWLHDVVERNEQHENADNDQNDKPPSHGGTLQPEVLFKSAPGELGHVLVANIAGVYTVGSQGASARWPIPNIKQLMIPGFGTPFKDRVEHLRSRSWAVELADESAGWDAIYGTIRVGGDTTHTPTPHQVIAADHAGNKLGLVEHGVEHRYLPVGDVEEAASAHRKIDEPPRFAGGFAKPIQHGMCPSVFPRTGADSLS